MYEYIRGRLVEASPTSLIVESGGFAYNINVSLNTYSAVSTLSEVVLYLHLIVREDAHLLYGFYSKDERMMFRHLISVSGIGANTANVMLSSMTVKEIASAIKTDNVNAIKSVKGIGIKTAQRVIIELRDKINLDVADAVVINTASNVKEEALAALVTLGYARAQVSKVLDKLISTDSSCTVESLIKAAFKHL